MIHLPPTQPTTQRILPYSVLREDPSPHGAVDTPDRAYDYWRHVIANQPDHEPDKETLCVVILNTRLHAFAWHRVSVGTVNECAAHPREVLRPVIVAAGYGFLILHNHPSGDPSPSRADELFTRRIVEASAIMQLSIVDHCVIGTTAPGRTPYYSFREAGLIP